MIISLVQEQKHHDYSISSGANTSLLYHYFRSKSIMIISLVQEQKHHDYIITSGAKTS